MNVVVSNRGSQTISVLLGEGNGSFIPQVTYGTGAGPVSVAIGDVDNDTRLDIIVAGVDGPFVYILFEQDDGSFSDSVFYLTGSYSPSVAVADLNNDTRLDMIAANINGLYIDQIFFDVKANSRPTSIVIGYFNDDNQLDTAAARSGTKQMGLLLEDGRGSFTQQANYPESNMFSPFSTTATDFNNDTNYIDISNVYNAASFKNQMRYSTGVRRRHLALDYVNNESSIDILVVNYDSDSLSIFFGRSNGSCIYHSTYSVGLNPIFVTVDDFNNDKRLDVVIANESSDSISVLLGFDNGTFSSSIIYSIDSLPTWSVAVGDFANDQHLDIVFVPKLMQLHQVTVLPKKSVAHIFDVSVAIADFNNDNYSYVITADIGSSAVSVLLGHGNGHFAPQQTSDAIALNIMFGCPNIVFRRKPKMFVGAMARSQSFAIIILIMIHKTYSTGSSSPYFPNAAYVINGTSLNIIPINYYYNKHEVFLGHGDGTLNKLIFNALPYSSHHLKSPHQISIMAIMDIHNQSHPQFPDLGNWEIVYDD
ncbi:unnamed protein product [Adineta ricciae]|uniref:VCBS repeat-containing protein n=1 Tax=Adineta ricciae TaxID=249248 RepID=A0A814QWM9_ADIRI|nr:unnamed protein product [Adineta ricciae]